MRMLCIRNAGRGTSIATLALMEAAGTSRSGNALRWAGALLAAWALAAGASPDSPPETALADYVAAPDSSYAWRVNARFAPAGADVVELRLHSQTWRDTLWKHQLYLIRPDGVDADSSQAVLIIGGGRWRSEYDGPPAAELPEDAGLYIGIAEQLEAIVAVVAQVPFQPMFERREDDLIAYTFERYLETGDAEWPLLLPMVKAAVRAMDATQAFAADEWNLPLERFTVLGGSKRGWTTWLTGAVDPRAAALAPIVIDALNFEAHMPHQITMWGAMSEELAPYTRSGLTETLSSSAGRDLRRIVDPYIYRDRLTQPKLIVVATNDRYFPVDALNLYWDSMPEPKHVLYLPNDGHRADDFGRLVPALAALHRLGADGVELPDLQWQFEQRGDGLRLCVRAAPPPASVVLWTADSEDTDFRDAVFAPANVDAGEDGFVADVEPPSTGFRAVFAEALLGDPDHRYLLSTNLRIMDSAGRPPVPAAAPAGADGICGSRSFHQQ